MATRLVILRRRGFFLLFRPREREVFGVRNCPTVSRKRGGGSVAAVRRARPPRSQLELLRRTGDGVASGGQRRRVRGKSGGDVRRGGGLRVLPVGGGGAATPRVAGTTIRSWPTSEESSTMKRKQSHNAYERDRRKKMNSLYSSLRTLLPESDQSKKLSIPNTVSKVLEYVPDLQRQVERLARKKEEILARMSSEKDGDPLRTRRRIRRLRFPSRLQGAGQYCTGVPGSGGLAIVNASFIAVNTSRGLLSLHCQVKDATAKVEPGKLRNSLPAFLR
ncbi:unnamed protein product [Spirodela intermedia]|uniref:Protein IRON-RELATED TRANSCRIPTION FACTOR 2 n=1 Tax=Spirodela intermedia TaxID=51605 RepID=A0A7I8JVH9_SPIIN|nr:unnamed protein product [Spirodela intermedia]CAA6673643.1 unnamed protein product [Spirodela intermedia]